MLQIVIPAFNEERRLPRTLRELRRYVEGHRGSLGRVEVLVVDNASTDRTAAVARDTGTSVLPVRVLRCDRPGKGAAVRAGLLATEGDLVCFMDADGATDLDALSGARRRMLLGADVVIGSRALDGSRTDARHSRVRSAGASVYRRCAARMAPGIADTQCGFKVFRGDLVRQVVGDLRTTGFSFDVELLVLLARVGARIEEMPVTWADVPGSRFVPIRHGAGAFGELAWIAWRHRTIGVTRGVPGTRPPVATRAMRLGRPTAAVVPLVVSSLVDLAGRATR